MQPRGSVLGGAGRREKGNLNFLLTKELAEQQENIMRKDQSLVPQSLHFADVVFVGVAEHCIWAPESVVVLATMQGRGPWGLPKIIIHVYSPKRAWTPVTQRRLQVRAIAAIERKRPWENDYRQPFKSILVFVSFLPVPKTRKARARPMDKNTEEQHANHILFMPKRPQARLCLEGQKKRSEDFKMERTKS